MANGKKGPEELGVTIGRHFTKENAAEFGRRGGKQSGKVRRDKKMLRDCIEILLEQKIVTRQGKKVTGAEALTATLFREALEGDTRAFEVLRDTAGQKPVDKIMIAEVDQNVIDEVEAMVNDDEE